MVNTCGFVEAAKKDSVDTLLAAADLKDSGPTQAVVAVGCLAERYGEELAGSLPEADAVLGFDDYPDIADRLRSILAGEAQHRTRPRTGAGCCRSRPSSGADGRRRADARARRPAPARLRRRLDSGPDGAAEAGLGLRPALLVLRDPVLPRLVRVAAALATCSTRRAGWRPQGVRELFLVSENSTSYGKDLGDLRLLETLLPELAAVDGVERVRVSYLQPAETRPGLVEAIATTPGVAPYFDLSFQHASAPVLRRMRRFGDAEAFLGLLEQIRALAPMAGVRSNVIVGFPGETEDDLEMLCDFLADGAPRRGRGLRLLRRGRHRGRGFDGKLDEDEIRARVEHVTALVDELTAQRAEDRIGERGRGARRVASTDGRGRAEGRAAHQGPEVDGTTTLPGLAAVHRSVT